jgi:acetyl-CoA acetyltransferase
MVPFTSPSRSESYDVMDVKASVVARTDASIDYGQVQQSYVGYVYGDSTSGQAALYGFGQTGIPIVDVNNACAAGSSALFLARQAVESGAVDCVLALGFEQMQCGGLGTHWSDRPTPFDRFDDVMHAVQGRDESPFAAQYFGGARRQYVEKYGVAPAVARIRTVRSGRSRKGV